MKRLWMKSAAALALAAALTTGSASALLGSKPAEAEAGAPAAQPLEISTYRDVPYQTAFPEVLQETEETEEPDQEAPAAEETWIFAVAEEPKKGTVVIEGASFTYTPEEGITGKDSFTYTVTDSQGRVSLPAKVSVVIEKPRSGVSYADTGDSPAAWAAQRLAEEGIFVGSRIGEQYYFSPELPVTRSEFLAMALETAGRQVTAVTMTGFVDDAAIPTWAKAYAAAGVADGILRGKSTAQGAAFQGEDPITFNEAATVLDRVLDLEDIDLEAWYADRGTAPTWASQAVGNLEAVSVLSAGSFGSPVMEQTVTRGDAARMLAAARTLLDGAQRGGGFRLFG